MKTATPGPGKALSLAALLSVPLAAPAAALPGTATTNPLTTVGGTVVDLSLTTGESCSTARPRASWARSPPTAP